MKGRYLLASSFTFPLSTCKHILVSEDAFYFLAKFHYKNINFLEESRYLKTDKTSHSQAQRGCTVINNINYLFFFTPYTIGRYILQRTMKKSKSKCPRRSQHQGNGLGQVVGALGWVSLLSFCEFQERCVGEDALYAVCNVNVYTSKKAVSIVRLSKLGEQ